MFFQAEAYVLMDYLAINCMVTSGFVCWLRNRYLFCLKQAYNNSYSCNTIDPSGTMYVYIAKPKFYVQMGFAVNWARPAHGLVSRNLYRKKITCFDVPWMAKFGKLSQRLLGRICPSEKQTNLWPCAQRFVVEEVKRHLKSMWTTQSVAGEKKYIELIVK